MRSTDGCWQFCEIIERTNVPGPIIATPAETERVVLKQHTETGAYRCRPFTAVMAEAEDAD